MKPPQFWVSNISPMNVVLSDLALTIKAFSTVNLLDGRHYYYTLEQLSKSADNGSLFRKRDKIKRRNMAPDTVKTEKILVKQDAVIPDRTHSIFVIKEENYEEFNHDQEKQKEEELYANDAADLTDTNFVAKDQNNNEGGK